MPEYVKVILACLTCSPALLVIGVWIAFPLHPTKK